MRLSGSRTYYRPTPPKMPPGLVELMEGLTREVLKNNPADIYGFCAAHVQKLLEIGDGPLRKKPLTLEEKVARAQEKVRERAEKRREQYDKSLLLKQLCDDGSDINVTSNKDDTPLISSQELLSANALKTPIHHEQELVNSSEVEIAHKPPTTCEDLQEENMNVTIKDGDAIKSIKDHTISHTEFETKNEIDNDKADDILTTDVNLNQFRNIVPEVAKIDVLQTEHTMDNENLHHLIETIADDTNNDQPEITEDPSFKDENTSLLLEHNELIQSEMVHTNGKETNADNSIIIDQDCLPINVNEKIINDLAQTEISKNIHNDDDVKKDANMKLNEQNSLIQSNTLIPDDIAKTQSEVLEKTKIEQDSQQSNGTQGMQQPVDIETIKSTNISQSHANECDQSTNSENITDIEGDDEDNINASDSGVTCFTESPVEIQDLFKNSAGVESLPATDTDSGIAIFINENSDNDELQHSFLNCDISRDFESATVSKVDHENTESNIKTSDDEEFQNDTDNQNQINNSDLIEKSIVESDTSNANENENINEHGSPKKSESAQMVNQDTSHMDLETAAVTIQKVFRTFLFKSRGSTFDDTVNDEIIFLDDDDKNKEDCDFPIAGSLNIDRRPHGITRMDTVLQTVNEEKSLSLSTDDSSTLSSAATVIQAHVRGFLVRNKLNSNKTVSSNSLAASNSNEPSLTSLEIDNDQNKNKTILNIHIVPEGGNYLSRDESFITSMDLSLDNSPPSSTNLHPLGYDKSERRKQLKREDAVQSISPPSNNSGKLSEDVDSVKELPLNDHVVIVADQAGNNDSVRTDSYEGTSSENVKTAVAENVTSESIVNINEENSRFEHNTDTSVTNLNQKRKSLTKMNSDEMDVVTPYISNEDNKSSEVKLMHSGECHDAVLPTKVSRSDTSVTSGE